MLTGDWTSTAFNRHDTAIFAAVGSQGTHPSSFTGGGQVGYNLQTGPAVLGIEADLNSLRLHASRFISSVPGTLSAPYSFAESFETDWIATVRGRLGYAYDRVLIYATGGLAIANHKFSQTITQLNFPFFQTGSVSATKDGWTVGGGLEYALGNGWSLKGEYLYADLGQVSVTSIGNCPTLAPGACSGFTGNHFDKLRLQIAPAGVNYKFDWGKGKAPVVAKY